jgi:hypothetical protein
MKTNEVYAKLCRDKLVTEETKKKLNVCLKCDCPDFRGK